MSRIAHVVPESDHLPMGDWVDLQRLPKTTRHQRFVGSQCQGFVTGARREIPFALGQKISRYFNVGESKFLKILDFSRRQRAAAASTSTKRAAENGERVKNT